MYFQPGYIMQNVAVLSQVVECILELSCLTDWQTGK